MTDETLLRLGEHLRSAAAAVFADAAPGIAESGDVELREDPFAATEAPALIAEIPLDAGGSGEIVLAFTIPGALRLAAVLGAIDEEAAEFGGAELSAPALDAIGAVAGRIAAGAAAQADLLLEPGAVATRIVADRGELRRTASGGEATVAPFSVLGEEVLAVQVVPMSVMARMEAGSSDIAGVPSASAAPLSGALHDVSVRVWAELGRSRMPTGEVVGLPSGAIVELDREAEDAVDLYVDGQLYATGRLVVCEDESWGVRVDRVLGLG